jgi:glutaredoxin
VILRLAGQRLLKRKGNDHEVIDATDGDELRTWLAEARGRRLVPQVLQATA